MTDKFSVIFLLAPLIFVCPCDQNLIVTTKNGKVLGKIGEDRNGNYFYSFQSIPYAKPPLGSLRFRSPQPVESWQNVLNATEEPPSCPQEHPTIPQLTDGQEDCLYLNIYTPKLPSKNKNDGLKSVMVYVHGGAFIRQTSSFYGPEFLLPGDIVLVTINYRLGFFGFMSLDDKNLGVPGNAGFKDQVMAMKWIKDNVKYFGGNPNSITIFGESAGGASVHLHMLSPLSKGLFHKVIAQSGCGLNTWAMGTKNNGILLAEQLNVTTTNKTALLATLQNLSEKEILEAQLRIVSEIPTISEPSKIGVVIETQTNEPAFLPAHPLTIIRSGNYTKFPLLIGYNDKEGLYLQIFAKANTGSFLIIKNFTKHLPYHLQNRSEIGKLVKSFYNKDIARYANKILMPTINFATDVGFLYFIYKTALLHARDPKQPVYFYRFSADTKLNLFKHRVSGFANYTGASHGDIWGYLFNTPLTPVITPGSLEDITVNRIVKLWTDFAKFGNPTPKHDPLIGLAWKPFLADKNSFLKIGNKLSMGTHLENERMQFWDDIYKKYSTYDLW